MLLASFRKHGKEAQRKVFMAVLPTPLTLQGLLFWLFEGGPKVSSGAVELDKEAVLELTLIILK